MTPIRRGESQMGVLCAKHQRRCLAYEEGKVIAGALNFISRSFLVRSCRGYYDDLRSVHLGLKDRCKGTASLEELGRSNKKTTQESIRYLRGGPNVVVSSNTAITSDQSRSLLRVDVVANANTMPGCTNSLELGTETCQRI